MNHYNPPWTSRGSRHIESVRVGFKLSIRKESSSGSLRKDVGSYIVCVT